MGMDNTFRVCYPYSKPSPPLTEAGWRLIASYHWPTSNGSLNKGVDFSNAYSARRPAPTYRVATPLPMGRV
jgi:hypothetical protein